MRVIIGPLSGVILFTCLKKRIFKGLRLTAYLGFRKFRVSGLRFRKFRVWGLGFMFKMLRGFGVPREGFQGLYVLLKGRIFSGSLWFLFLKDLGARGLGFRIQCLFLFVLKLRAGV